MANEELLAETVRLTTCVEALASLAAYARIDAEGLEADPLVRTLLAKIAAEVLGGEKEIVPSDVAPAVGMARAFLRAAVDQVDDPGRRGNWAVVDPQLLQGLGRLSGAIATAIRAAEDELEDLSAMLRSPGAAILDVGTGTGWLSIALAQTYPSAHVVGLDLFDTALELARQNVIAEGLTGRVELRLQDVTALTEEQAYDVIWLPLPFLPREVVEPAMSAARRALKPGGWVLPGMFAGPPDRLSQLLLDLRTVRSGGHPWSPEQIIDLMTTGGFSQAREVPRTWAAPVRLYAGRRDYSG
jgi:SAM-dependent methyltransferase